MNKPDLFESTASIVQDPGNAAARTQMYEDTLERIRAILTAKGEDVLGVHALVILRTPDAADASKNEIDYYHSYLVSPELMVVLATCLQHAASDLIPDSLIPLLHEPTQDM